MLYTNTTTSSTSAASSAYLAEFRRIYCAGNHLAAALSGAVRKYQDEDLAPRIAQASDEISDKENSHQFTYLQQELQRYVAHCSTAKIGSVILRYRFNMNLPEELKQLFEVARLIEESVFCASSKLISDCENAAAAAGHSPKAIYEQCIRLEQALVRGEVEDRHRLFVTPKLNQWLIELYAKFSELLMSARTKAELEALVAQSFPEAQCKDLPKVKEVRDEIDCQIEYLTNNQFLDHYFACKDLSARYTYVLNFYMTWRYSTAYTDELRATLCQWMQLAVKNAYIPTDKRMHKLIEHDAKTVFEMLQEWIDAGAWRKFKGTPIEEDLKDKFAETKAKYLDWSEVGQQIQAGLPKPMFELHAMRYCGDPDQDPKQLLLKVSSPKKRKQAEPTAPSRPLDASILYTDEVLDPMLLASPLAMHAPEKKGRTSLK